MPAKPSILVLAPLSPTLRGALAARYDVVTDLQDAAQIRAAVTSGGSGISAEVVERLPALKLIAIEGVGYDRVDIAHAHAHGIAVTNTPDVLTDDVADMAVGLLYAAARRIAANDAFVRSGAWARRESVPFGHRLTGRRIGIIGLGRIGHAIAERLLSIAGSIAYHNRHRLPDVRYAYYDSPAALAGAVDVLILAASSAVGAPPIVDTIVLEALGPNGIFVNIARGHAVDETALVRAITGGRILAAGLDVFADEPNVPPELIASSAVVLQPHQGSATAMTRTAMGELVLANLAAFFDGQPLVTPV